VDGIRAGGPRVAPASRRRAGTVINSQVNAGTPGSSPCLSALATVSPAAQSTVVVLSLSRSLSLSLSESARA